MLWQFSKIAISAVLIATTSTVAQRQPRLGALLLSLPVVSILAFVFMWIEHRDMASVAKLAQETLILLPLSLPFFLPLALGKHYGFGFWTCFVAGMFMTSLTIGCWLRYGSTPGL